MLLNVSVPSSGAKTGSGLSRVVPPETYYARIFKRWFDLVLRLSVLLLFSPCLFW